MHPLNKKVIGFVAEKPRGKLITLISTFTSSELWFYFSVFCDAFGIFLLCESLSPLRLLI